MKLGRLIFFTICIALSGFKVKPLQNENVELTCFKAHKATNTCHFNFTIDGARYRFVDIGCKYNKKHAEVVKKAKEGTLALAKDWKVACDSKAP